MGTIAVEPKPEEGGILYRLLQDIQTENISYFEKSIKQDIKLIRKEKKYRRIEVDVSETPPEKLYKWRRFFDICNYVDRKINHVGGDEIFQLLINSEYLKTFHNLNGCSFAVIMPSLRMTNGKADVFTRKSIDREYSEAVVKFNEFKEKWESETAFYSLSIDKAMNNAYQRIIGMGKEAIPLILAEMRKKSGHWFWALEAITGENPIRDENRGKIDDMINDWLRWGEDLGYIVS